MSSSFAQKIEDFFSNPDQFNPENMESFVQETISFFMDLQSKISSPDEKDREAAKKTAEEIKAKLEGQVQKLCESLGMSSQEMTQHINTAAHFSPKDWQALQNAKTEIEKYKESLTTPKTGEESVGKKASKKKAPKLRNQWLAS